MLIASVVRLTAECDRLLTSDDSPDSGGKMYIRAGSRILVPEPKLPVLSVGTTGIPLSLI